MNLSSLKDIAGPLSPSMINLGKRCTRKFMYRYRWGLVPKSRPYAPSADVGHLTHRLLELGQEKGVEIVKIEMRQLQDDLCKRIEAGEDLTGGMARTVNELTDLFNKARVMAEIFWEKYPSADDAFETVAREIRLFGGKEEFPPYGLSGKIDRLVRSKSDGAVWVRDIKCTSFAPHYILTGIRWSAQYQIYGFLAQTLVKNPPGASVVGFIWDVLQIPGIKFCKKDKDWAAYLDRVKEWYVEKEMESGTSPVVSQALYYNNSLPGWRAKYTENAWPDSITYTAGERFISNELWQEIYKVGILNTQSLHPELFPKDITCGECRYNRQICPYHALCNADEDSWPVVIERNFETIKEDEVETEREQNESETNA